MEILPAIDLRGGGAVRLEQGDFSRERRYGDPLVLAARFAAAGTRWLHVVDLDAARTGEPVHRAVVKGIARRMADIGVSVQTGGGVRTMEDVDDLVEGGVARVVLGTAALADPALLRGACSRHPDRVVLGLDYRRVPGPAGPDRLIAAAHGWTGSAGREVEDVLRDHERDGLAAVVATAIDRDGMLGGPDLDGLRRLLATGSIPVVASGGVGSVADTDALDALDVAGRRLAGAIVGRALVDGRVDAGELCARYG